MIRKCAVYYKRHSFSSCEHGTHVAGIAAGRGNNFSGIAKDANIIAIQVFVQMEGAICGEGHSRCLQSFMNDQIQALNSINNFYSKYYKIAAVNLSLGGGYYTKACDGEYSSYASVINALKRKGIATVIASGNEGYIDGIAAPACISSAISVGSTTKEDEISSFSNSADFLDILAPGGFGSGNSKDIYSAIPDGKYQYSAGTSMAAPHIAGGYAIIREKYPEYGPNQIASFLAGNGVPVRDLRNNQVKYRMLYKELPPVSTITTDFLTNVEMDQSGNTYIAGGVFLESGFVRKYGAQNTFLWEVQLNKSHVDTMTVDKHGNVYVLSDHEIHKYNTSGKLLWSNGIGDNGITVDNEGNIYTLWRRKVYKYDAEGEEMWNAIDESEYSNSSDYLNSKNLIAIDSNGNLFVVLHEDCIDEEENCDNDYRQTRVVQFSPEGEFNWGKTFRVPALGGGWLHNSPTSAALDRHGNFYVAGYVCTNENGSYTKCRIIPPSMVDTNSEEHSLMLLKFQPDGNLEWSIVSKLDGYGVIASKLIIDPVGNIYIGGGICKKLSAISQRCEDNDYLTVKYDSNGRLLWKETFSGTPRIYEQINDIAFDERKNQIYVTGFTNEEEATLCASFHCHANRTIAYDATTGTPLFSQLYPIIGEAALAHLTQGNAPAMLASNGSKVSAVFIHQELDDTNDNNIFYTYEIQ